MKTIADLIAVQPKPAPMSCAVVGCVRAIANGPAKGDLVNKCARCGKPFGLETREAPHEVGTFKVENPETAPREKRFAGLQDLVLGADADSRNFEGYGCRYGVKDSYDTVFVQGCFAASLADWRSKGQWPSFYLQHDWDLIIGGYNDMHEDNSGLFVRGDFLDSAWGEHARQLVKAKRARGLSIGFIALEWRIEQEGDRFVRYVTKADLYEVSLVERPAVPGSGVTAIRADASVRDVESALVETLGIPREAAKAMAGQWKPKGEARDAATQEAERAALEAQARDARAAAEATVNRELIEMLHNASTRLKS